MQHMKIFKDSDIIETVTNIIEQEDVISITIIRDKLRKQNFWATRNLVKETMVRLVEDGCFDGIVNEYFV